MMAGKRLNRKGAKDAKFFLMLVKNELLGREGCKAFHEELPG